MGCLASKELDVNDPLYQAKQADRAITEALNRNNRQKQLKKVLILGTGDSGKLTVIKQLRILSNREFSKEERARYSQVIWSDAVTCMCVLIVEARKAKVPLDSDDPDSALRVYNKAVLAYKKMLLSSIDTEAAGGEEFLKDYHLKYAGTSQQKRAMMSTGKVEAFDDGYDAETLSLETDSASESQKSETSSVTGFARRKAAVKPLSRFEVAQAVSELWTKDRGIREIWERRNEFQIELNANYYFDNVMRFVDPGYLASDKDILAARIKTTGIQETMFNIRGQNFKFLDAGGQRSERRKWLKSFQGITAVLFVLAVSEYDQMLFEDHKVNRLVELMSLFKNIVNSRWFYDTPFILFLNKTDLFEEKVQRTPLAQYLPDYKGPPDNPEEGLKYFERTFLRYNKTKKPVYIHRTCATDTKSMNFVMTAVMDFMIQENLRATGMM